MKGLLMKDSYTIFKTYKLQLFMIPLFSIFSVLENADLFFVFFPCFFAVLMAPTLLTADEQSGWNVYYQTLPLSKTQYVSEKFLIGLFVQLAALLFVCAAQLLKMSLAGAFCWQDFGILLCTLIVMNCIMPALLYPVIFRYGSEKGRLVYLVGLGCFFGFLTLVPNALDFALKTIAPNLLLPLLSGGALLLYLLSWPLSIRLYQKREI